MDVWLAGATIVLLNFNFFILNYLLFIFYILILKIIFKKIKKYYFNIFLIKIYFKKQSP
jgi:hypothetical protein